MTSRLRKHVGILVIVAAGLIGTTVLAQSPFAPAHNPFDAVLAKLDQILQVLDPDTPAAGPVTLSSGILSKHQDDFASCHVTNVSTTTIPNVRIVLLDRIGNTVADRTFDVLPGESRRLDFNDGLNFTRCQFSYVGFAHDVRATQVIWDAATLDPLAALDAR
jgi:hypothetical protein